MDPDADDLLLFARVVDTGSFSAAAQRVGAPKSTVSRRLSALEKRLGQRLLQRTTRKLVLTDFGRDVLEHARAVAAEVDSARALAWHAQGRPSGLLRVSMPGDFASIALAPVLAGFTRDYPEVELDIDLSPRRVDLIGENFDLAIRMGELQDDAQLAARRLALFTAGLYASPDLLARHGRPLLPQALVDMPGLVLRSRAGDAVPWSLTPRTAAPGSPDAAPVKILPARRTRANSPDLLIRLARHGAGVAVAGDFFADPYVRGGELERVLPDWCLPLAPAWAVFPGRRLMPTKTRVFIDALALALRPVAGPAPQP